MSKRKKHNPEFKARVVLEALKGEQTVLFAEPVVLLRQIQLRGRWHIARPSLLDPFAQRRKTNA